MTESAKEILKFIPIGTIHSPFHAAVGTPVQPRFSSANAQGVIEIFEEFADGLKDLHEFSHVLVIYRFHQIASAKLTVVPFLDNAPHGIFATRSPARPNPIGVSLLPLLKIEERLLHVSHLDMLDGTPVLDVKPFVPAFDSPSGKVSAGWFERVENSSGTQFDDGRFTR